MVERAARRQRRGRQMTATWFMAGTAHGGSALGRIYIRKCDLCNYALVSKTCDSNAGDAGSFFLTTVPIIAT